MQWRQLRIQKTTIVKSLIKYYWNKKTVILSSIVDNNVLITLENNSETEMKNDATPQFQNCNYSIILCTSNDLFHKH